MMTEPQTHDGNQDAGWKGGFLKSRLLHAFVALSAAFSAVFVHATGDIIGGVLLGVQLAALLAIGINELTGGWLVRE